MAGSTVVHGYEVEGGVVRADPQDTRTRGAVGPGARTPVQDAPEDGARGAGVAGPAAAQGAPSPYIAGAGPLEGDDRRLDRGRPGGAQEAAPHRPAGVAAPGRGVRRRRGRVDRAALRGRGAPAPAHGPAGGDGAPA